jgi:hypothetical protein
VDDQYNAIMQKCLDEENPPSMDEIAEYAVRTTHSLCLCVCALRVIVRLTLRSLLIMAAEAQLLCSFPSSL